ncbi:hypothetical protein FOYG_02249 [Fusarium oxysporum NRRL 32931]|uniref:Xylanolytic transcriptional activator regulatory domain-containing protein n=1 Tax=Fusarium oxysporum NRRL 32931 TaxID=660029 RepID=W9IVU3_FUSOX|nr:hypothetical protein FOYG_02249 [Fusarium oxysporum NRRL 32931]
MINPQYVIIIQRMNGKVALALHPLQRPNSDYSPASDVHAANNDAIAQSLFVNHAKKLKQNALAQRPRGLLYPCSVTAIDKHEYEIPFTKRHDRAVFSSGRVPQTPLYLAFNCRHYKNLRRDPESTARLDSLWEGISAYLHHPQGSKHRLRIPPADANKALEIYLAVVDFRFPRLPVDKVLLGIDAISHVEEDHFRRVVATDPAHVFMAYAVITIVPLVSDAYPISQGSWVSVHLLGKCMELLDRVFNQEDGIDIIQCLQLLVILAVHCSAAGSAWHLSSFAMNKCIALGYHRDDPKSASMSLLDVQQRRWAFWGCYFLDVLICAALGRPPSIDVKHITTPLPADPASNSSSQCAQHGQIISNLRTSPSTTHRLVSRDVYHKQLFQYARLLSQVVSEATNSPK